MRPNLSTFRMTQSIAALGDSDFVCFFELMLNFKGKIAV